MDERIHSVEWDGYDSQDSAERATGASQALLVKSLGPRTPRTGSPASLNATLRTDAAGALFGDAFHNKTGARNGAKN